MGDFFRCIKIEFDYNGVELAIDTVSDAHALILLSLVRYIFAWMKLAWTTSRFLSPVSIEFQFYSEVKPFKI